MQIASWSVVGARDGERVVFFTPWVAHLADQNHVRGKRGAASQLPKHESTRLLEKWPWGGHCVLHTGAISGRQAAREPQGAVPAPAWCPHLVRSHMSRDRGHATHAQHRAWHAVKAGSSQPDLTPLATGVAFSSAVAFCPVLCPLKNNEE